MSAIDEDDTATIVTTVRKTVESTWDVPGLKKEVFRLIQRCHKKVGQANNRLTVAKETVDRLTSDPLATLEQLEQCPDVDSLAIELREIQARLRKLNELEESLLTVVGSKKKNVA